MADHLHVIVIGAGLAGLAAARQLRAAGLRVTVLERACEVGGRARSALVEGCRVELGAEFLASFYTRTMALLDELGMRRELRRIPRSTAILRNGRLFSLWPNARVAFTPLIGSRHKLALSYLLGSLVRHGPLLDLHAFHRAHPIDDMAISEYAHAHLSAELLEYVLQPALSGIFYYTPEQTSRALLLQVLRAGLSRPAGMQLFTLREGLGQLSRTMAAGLELRLDAEVELVEPNDAGGYRVQFRQRGVASELRADALVMATTAPVVPQLLPWLGAARREFFAAIQYSASANLAVVTRAHLPRNFYGLLFPRRETPYLASATVQTVKDRAAAPRGRDVICLHLSGLAAAALRDCDDATLAKLLLAELARLTPRYDPRPLAFQQLFRCPEALPLFDVGHFRRLQRFAAGEIEQKRLVFAGDYLGGPFVEGAIVSGEQAATRLLARLKSETA